MRFLAPLARGELVSRPALERMTGPGRFGSRYSGYGLGVEVRHPGLQTLVWGHGGFLPGFRGVAWHVPSENLNIVVLSNESRYRPGGLAELILGRMIR